MLFSWPSTPRTLLTRIANLAEGEDEAEWTRFVDLYGPAIARFIHMQDPQMPTADVEDMVQETLAKLVPVLRSCAFDPRKAKFSTYLSTIVRREMIDRMRRMRARRADCEVPLASGMETADARSDPAANVDIAWRLARHQAAEQLVLTRSALQEQSRRIYLMSTADGLSAKEIGQRLGLAENAVRAIRSRVAKMVASVEAQYDD